MTPRRSVRSTAATTTAARRLRDLLRSEILLNAFPTGKLPGETELMIAFGVSRATVRGALSLLREEGVVDRVQGIGTFVMAHPTKTNLERVDLGGGADADRQSHSDSNVHPRIIDQRTMVVPGPVARRLAVPPDTECLCLEYVILHFDHPTSVVTSYTLFPEARRLLETAYRADWHSYLADAAVDVGDSEYFIGSLAADSGVAALLKIAERAPVTLVQQVTMDPAGRPFNFAVMYSRSDRVMFSYRSPATDDHRTGAIRR